MLRRLLTAKRLKRLAALWRVSQAEVVRRAVAQAEAAATAAAKPVRSPLCESFTRRGRGGRSGKPTPI